MFALYAFNHEIAKTREVVTETQLGLIRLQWWRDALAGVYERGDVLQHQVLQPLAAAIKAHDLPRDALDNLIYAREFDLEDRLPSTLAGMERYAEYTSAPLLALALKVQGIAAADADIRPIATAYALTGLLRAVPLHLSQRRCYLPEDLLSREGLTAFDLYDGSGVDRLAPVIKAVAARAEELLANATAQDRQLRRMKKLTRLYLDRLKKDGHDIFRATPVLMKEIRLLF